MAMRNNKYASSPIRSLEEVGEILGITRERVRQIEVSAFKKLKHSKSYNKLLKAKFYESGQ